jgi:hypothetical protein
MSKQEKIARLETHLAWWTAKPLPLAVADKLVRQRIAQASGCRRYRLVKVRVA